MIEDHITLAGASLQFPLQPENTGVARLQCSPYVDVGQVYRVLVDYKSFAPEIQPSVTMLINPIDLVELRQSRLMGSSDQAIADTLEQIFAEKEAMRL